MTRARRSPSAPAAPLADTLRSALAQGWHSLAALDALAGGTASTRRARVHAALAELADAGVAREERMGTTGAEVRLVPVTLPAPMPDDGDDGLDAEDREAARVAITFPCSHGPCPDPGPGRGCHCRAANGFAFTSDDWCNCECHFGVVIDTTVYGTTEPSTFRHAPAPREPGPSSRCAVCASTYVKHESVKAGHAFTPKPRGRPRVAPIPNAAPAVLPRARQRAKRGPVVDVDVGRVERSPPALDTRGQPSPEERSAVARIEAIAHAGTGRCRPPACHRDDIHEPSRVRGFARPLCEAHRLWVEAAGGSVRFEPKEETV